MKAIPSILLTVLALGGSAALLSSCDGPPPPPRGFPRGERAEEWREDRRRDWGERDWEGRREAAEDRWEERRDDWD